MLFAHDTEVALAAVAALINSADPERLSDTEALDEFVRSWGWTGVCAHDDTELCAVRALRAVLRGAWESAEEPLVGIVNGLLRKARALPQLVKHDEWDYHLHATPPDAPLAVRMAVEAAMAFVDVIRGKALDRLLVCEYPGCENVIVDLSRNRSRRFCEDGCGNRSAVAAYRARKAGRNPVGG